MLYLFVANHYISTHASSAAVSPTLFAKQEILTHLHGWLADVRQFNQINPVHQFLSYVIAQSNYVGFSFLTLSGIAQIPLILYTSLLQKSGLIVLDGIEIFWKLPYLVCLWMCMSARSFIRLANVSSFFAWSLTIFLMVCGFLQRDLIMSWIDKNPTYLPQVAFNLLAHQNSSLGVDFASLKIREADKENLLKFASDTQIVLTPESQGYLLGDPRFSARYIPFHNGKWLWVQDLKKPYGKSKDPNAQQFFEYWGRLPTAFSSTNFMAKWSILRAEEVDLTKYLPQGVRFSRPVLNWPYPQVGHIKLEDSSGQVIDVNSPQLWPTRMGVRGETTLLLPKSKSFVPPFKLLSSSVNGLDGVEFTPLF
jgi:hypothetical protein